MTDNDKRKLEDQFLEKLMVKAMLVDSQYTATLSSVFDPSYFQSEQISKIYKTIIDHYKTYNDLIPTTAVVNSFSDESEQEKISNIFKEVESIDFDVAKNYDFLFNETNQYLKEQAFKDALMKGVDLIEKKENPLQYKNIIEDALAKDLKIDLGLNYWDDLNERLKRVLSQSEVKIPSYYPILDEFINGGFPTYTLSVILSKIHGGKSNTLVNIASRQVLKGYNPLIISLEMSEDAFAQRLDSIYSKQDINRIYLDSTSKKNMISSLKEIKNNNGLGNLIIKEFPTGKATTQDIEMYIRELNYRGIKPGPIYCDYLQLLKSGSSKDKRYEELKTISEDLRALSLTHQTPVISVCQINREGSFTEFKDVDFNSVAGSLDIAATADFIMILGQDEDSLIYESEVHYRVVKNRLGGRVGEMGKFYLDKKSLKVYDESELNVWVEDAKISGDSRKPNKDRS